MSEKLIIVNESSKSMLEIMPYVSEVLRMGKISRYKGRDQYCFVSAFENAGIIVHAYQNEKSDRLVICDCNQSS